MKNIKKYEDFLNEELKPETYRSAAEKLDKKGHKSRAKSLSDFANRQHNKQLSDTGYIDVELYGKKYRLDDDNIVIHNDGETDGNIELTLAFDKEIYDLIGDDNFEQIWNSLDKSDREKFVNIFKGEILTDYDDIMDVKYDNIDKDGFIEFAEMEMSPFIFIELIKSKGYKPDISGLLIKDRKVANKLLKLLKNYANIKGGVLKNAIDTLTVNDLYES